MGKVRFKMPRMGYPAGHVVEESAINEGVLKTLWQFGVLESVEDDNKLDDSTPDKPKHASSKRSPSKKSSKPKS